MSDNVDKLTYACLAGDISTAESLLRTGTSVNSPDTDGFPPLYCAAQGGHTAVVELLLQRPGAEVNVTNKNGDTPLFVASGKDHRDTVQLLLEHGASVNQAQTTTGSTPLFMASQNGHLSVVSVLLEHGASVNQAMTTGSTPLFMASQKGHLSVVSVLLEHGASVNQAQTTTGCTPLFQASQNGHLSVVSVLLEHGASVNQAQTTTGSTPLFMASQNGHLSVVSVLLEHGASVNQAMTTGSTPLFMASQKGHLSVVSVLLEHGASVNQAQTTTGCTPLFQASQNGHLSVVSVLLEHGASVNQAGKYGTPLSQARRKGHDAVVEALEQHTAAASHPKTPDSEKDNQSNLIPGAVKTVTQNIDSDRKTKQEDEKVHLTEKTVKQKIKAFFSRAERSDRKSDVKKDTQQKAEQKEHKTVTQNIDSDRKTKQEDEKVHLTEKTVKQKIKAFFSRAERSDRKSDVKKDTQQKAEQKEHKTGIVPATLQRTDKRVEEFTSPHASTSSFRETTQMFSEKHKENLMNRAEYFTKKLQFPSDVLRRLIKRGVFGEDIEKKIMGKSTCDEDISQNILNHLVLAKREDFVIFIEVLLQTNQRLVANIMYRTLPKEEYSDLPMPELKSRNVPKYQEIPSGEIIFARPHGANEQFQQIGAGAFSVIQLATYTAIDAKVAFKRVKGSEYGGMNAKDIREFMKEASTLYTVRHPNIITIYGTTCDSEKHIYGMVMELMEVGSLYDLMAQIEIPWPIKVRILNDVGRGLKFLNTPQRDRPYPVSHCDIKASNVLINGQFSAKIADFGESVLHNITMRTSTSSSSKSGTTTHMAPELLKPTDGNYDPTEKSDIWSFGVTIFEVCAENSSETGERRTPFPKRMNYEQIFGMIGMNRQSPFNEKQMEKIPKDCPPFLIDLLKKCCQVQRDDRLNFTEAAKILDHHYIGEFKKEIHQAMCLVHRRYGEKVLGLKFSTSDAEDLSSESIDSKSQLLDKVQKLLLSAEESPKSAERFESKLDQLKNVLNQELHTISDKMDRKLIESVLLTIDVTAKMAKDMQEKTAEPSVHKRLNELEHRLIQNMTDQMSKMGIYDDTYDFKSSLIQKNYEALVTGIYPDDVLDYLYQEGTLSVDDYERVRAQTTTRDQSRLMLIKVDARGDDGITKLCAALTTTPQAYLINLLK